jgi:site-specific DNA-methyltransferase (adenine-specific)
MPESATDRFTRATEMLFLFTKKPKYYFKQLFEPQHKDRHVTSVQAAQNSEQHRDGERWPNEEGRNMRDWWVIPPAQLSEAHFASFPEEIVRRCVEAGCKPGGVVLDPFMGSGTTAVVARHLGFRSMGIELNPIYCELIARRTGQLSFTTEEVA